MHDEYVGKKTELVLQTDTRLYKRPFSEYAADSFAKVGFKDCPFSPEQLDTFYARKDIQIKIRQIFFASTIRSFLGRPLEVYLLLDRCLYLQDNGYRAELIKFFDENVSPRAIGLYAEKMN